MTNRTRNISLFVVIIAAVTLFSLMGEKSGIYLDFCEESLTVSVSDFEAAIPYADIAALELSLLPDSGTIIEGADKHTVRYGTWQNDTWGEYTLCITPKVSQGLVLTLKDGSIFILNYQDTESTEALYKMFTDLLHSKGYLGK